MSDCKCKPDDRRDNSSKIKANIASTKAHMEAAEEMITETDNDKMKSDLQEKNQRRAMSLEEMKHELQDELPHATKRNQ